MLNEVPIGSFLKLTNDNKSIIWFKKGLCSYHRLSYEGTRLTSSILSKRVQTEEEDIQFLLSQGYKVS